MITIINRVVIIGIKLDDRSLLSPQSDHGQATEVGLKICTTATSSFKTKFLPIGGPAPCMERSSVSNDMGHHQGVIK